ncbi:MAG: hypothetical protein OHK0038_26050 [Flammeovirgaceae bacterium]
MKKIIKNTFTMLSLVGALLSNTNKVFAQDEGYIYGQVVMVNGEKFTGQLRWGKEEAFWTDLFNSQKPENQFLKYVDKKDLKWYEKLERYTDDESIDWKRDFMSIWDNNWDFANSHTFACRYGDIEVMKVRGDDEVILKFKNGEQFRLEGGSNDVDEDIFVYDEELGKVELDWDRIEEIRFLPTPSQLKSKAGEPLYGRVKTFRKGIFEGFIQWDHEECVSSDKLDGDSNNGKMSIEMGNIRSITSEKRGCKVVLKSGREVYLDGSNDVNADNRGIVVKNEDYGRVLIEWREFESIEFIDTKSSGIGYKDFPAPKFLEATIKTIDNKEHTGKIIYDLDEYLDIEVLDGKDDGLEYKIPFQKIKKITPKNHSYSKIQLKSGAEILLGDIQDVTESNDGILVYSNKPEDGKVIKWADIEEIIFK